MPLDVTGQPMVNNEKIYKCPECGAILSEDVTGMKFCKQCGWTEK